MVSWCTAGGVGGIQRGAPRQRQVKLEPWRQSHTHQPCRLGFLQLLYKTLIIRMRHDRRLHKAMRADKLVVISGTAYPNQNRISVLA
jgi:hypothetical protein